MSSLIEPARAQSETVLHAFRGGSDGFEPFAGLTNVKGTLYGSTISNGAGNCQILGLVGCGTVFKISTKGAETVLHTFQGSPNDGGVPWAPLVDVGGTLYGTTRSGGANGLGTVFKITRKGVATVLHSFGNGSDGANPSAGLIDVGGNLYGTTEKGGTGSCSGGCGTVFKITTTGVENVLYSFKGGSDGANPTASLINVNGTLYGTTKSGGPGSCQILGTVGCGTVFKLTTKNVETVLYSFKGGNDGAYPEDASLIAVGDTLYGTTAFGGTGSCTALYVNQEIAVGGNGCGTVFKTTTAGVETVLYSFKGGSDGIVPQGGLINIGGTLYGTTGYGGGAGGGNCSFDCGTVFKITMKGVETVLYAFKGGKDGAYPGGLVNVAGILYGTTQRGGGNCSDPFGCGTVFKVAP